MLRKTLAIIRKDTIIRFASRSELLFFIILPIIFTAILGGGLAMGGDGDNRVDLPVVDEDRSPQSVALLALLEVSSTVHPEPMTAAEAAQLADDGDAAGVLTIPAGLGRTFNGVAEMNAPPPLRLALDPSNTSGVVIEQAVRLAATQLSAPQQVAAAVVAEAQAGRGLGDDEAGALFGAAHSQATALLAATPDRLQYTILGTTSDFGDEAAGQASAGQLITWVLIPLLGTAALMAYERTNGTLRRLLVTPSPRATFLLGTLSGQLLWSLVQMALLVGFGVLVMGVNWGSSPAGLALLLVSFGLAGVSMGVMLGTFTRTDSQAGNLSIMLGMVMALLGGCWWPIELFPEGVRAAVKVLPTTWAMQGLTDITLRGQGLAGVWPEALVLLGFAAVFFAIGVRRFRYE